MQRLSSWEPLHSAENEECRLVVFLRATSGFLFLLFFYISHLSFLRLFSLLSFILVFLFIKKTHTHEKLLGGRCSCKNEEVRDATSSLRVGTLLSSGCCSAWIIHACFVGSRPVALCASACGRSVWVPPPVIESMGMAPGGSE